MHDRAVFGPLRLGMENGAGVQTETVFSRTTLGQTRSKIREDAKRLYRSALQTHLQGVDWATLAMMPEIHIHAQPSFFLGCKREIPLLAVGNKGS